MTRFLLNFFFFFLALTGAVTILLNSTQTFEFGSVDFWKVHGPFFLIFISFFPRLTLLFSSIPFGGLLWWLGFFFAPRLLVAFLATIAYWNTNPLLVTCAWIIALSGEPMEKSIFRKRVFIRTSTNSNQRQNNPFQYSRNIGGGKTIIDVESEVK